MRGKLSFSFGFTLIELLVSILVISILFGLGYANFRQYSQKQTVWAVARKIEGDLRRAQDYALSGRGNCSSGYLLGYQLRWINGSTYQIRGVCRNGIENSYINSYEVGIGNSVVISDFNAPSDPYYGLDGIVFYTPKGGTNLTTIRRILVSLSSGLYPVGVVVSPSGKIIVSE